MVDHFVGIAIEWNSSIRTLSLSGLYKSVLNNRGVLIPGVSLFQGYFIIWVSTKVSSFQG